MSTDTAEAPLLVQREVDVDGVRVRLIGELDLSTVDVLEAELWRNNAHSPPRVIDLSELSFLDLTGLRALCRAAAVDEAHDVQVVGATGIVRRLMELAEVLCTKAGKTAAGR